MFFEQEMFFEMEKIRHIGSVSGGKSSTAMVLKMIEEGMQLDELCFFDSGWEFPIMKKMVKKLAKRTGIKLTVLKPPMSFEEILYALPVVRKKGEDKGKVYRYGHGWPVHNRRWHDREMVNVINRHCGHSIQYLGYPYELSRKAKQADRSRASLFEGTFDTKKTFEEVTNMEKKKNTRYPLIEFGMTGEDCLKLCGRYGFDYEGFYDHRDRAGMYCCPLQPMSSIKLLRKEYPELWKHMLEMDSKIEPNFGFNHGKTIAELEERFQREDKKIKQLLEGGLL